MTVAFQQPHRKQEARCRQVLRPEACLGAPVSQSQHRVFLLWLLKLLLLVMLLRVRVLLLLPRWKKMTMAASKVRRRQDHRCRILVIRR